MSPIDIVPIEENMYGLEVESNMDIVPNHRIYHSERTDSTIFSNSSNHPFVQPPSKQAPNTIKQTHDVCIQSYYYYMQFLIETNMF